MIRYIVFTFTCLLAASIKGEKISELDGRIVGGVNVTIENYPYQVSLQDQGKHMCGGSIISKEFIITAAHCTDGIDAILLTVRVGTSTRELDGEVYEVKQFFQNPQFDVESMDYDISIIQLENALNFGPSVQPIALPDEKSELNVGMLLTVTGWGSLEEGGEGSSQLQAVSVPYIDFESCKQDYKGTAVTERMICAGGSKGGKDSCQGDSGGPLVAEGVLIGIVSWGLGCANPLYPGVYSCVSQLRDFIKNVTNF